jgi:hypothetical protein
VIASLPCIWYYLRTRRIGSSVILLGLLGLGTRLWATLGAPEGFAAETRMVPALVAISIIGIQSESPCPIVERVASTRMTALRLAHLGGLLLLSSAVFLLAGQDLTVIRNTAGLGGIFLLLALFVDASLALLPTLMFGAVSMLGSPTASWNWASAPITSWTADTTAAVACGLGFILYSCVGGRQGR